MDNDYNSHFYHVPLPINKDGDGPETNLDLVTNTICWGDLEEWPCKWIRNEHASS